MSDEQFKRDLQRVLARMMGEPASPALRARVGDVLAAPRPAPRPQLRLAPQLVVGFAAAVVVVAFGALVLALCPPSEPVPAASPSPRASEAVPTSTSPAIVVPSGTPPLSWARVLDAPLLHVAPASGTAVAVAPDGTFVAIASALDSRSAPVLLHSADGATWTAGGSLPSGYDTQVNAIARRGDLLVAIGTDVMALRAPIDKGGPGVAMPGGAVWTSTDGRTWRRMPYQPALGAGELDRVTAGPAGFLAVGREYDQPAWSADGTTWSRVDVGTPNALVRGVAATDDGFVAVGGVEETAVAWASPDGQHWQRGTFADGSDANASLLSVAAQGRRLVAVGAVPAPGDEAVASSWTGLAAWLSIDGGLTWRETGTTLHGTAPDLYPPSIPELYALSGGFIAFGNPGAGGVAVWSTTDGVTWRKDAIDATNEDWSDALAISGSRAVMAGRTVGTGMGGDRAEFWTGDVNTTVEPQATGVVMALDRAGRQPSGWPFPSPPTGSAEPTHAEGLALDPRGDLVTVARTDSGTTTIVSVVPVP